MSDRCPNCSLQPESDSDYCDKHRPRHDRAVTTLIDEFGNCPDCGPEGCTKPDNHAEPYKKLLQQATKALKKVAQRAPDTIAGDAIKSIVRNTLTNIKKKNSLIHDKK